MAGEQLCRKGSGSAGQLLAQHEPASRPGSVVPGNGMHRNSGVRLGMRKVSLP